MSRFSIGLACHCLLAVALVCLRVCLCASPSICRELCLLSFCRRGDSERALSRLVASKVRRGDNKHLSSRRVASRRRRRRRRLVAIINCADQFEESAGGRGGAICRTRSPARACQFDARSIAQSLARPPQRSLCFGASGVAVAVAAQKSLNLKHRL